MNYFILIIVALKAVPVMAQGYSLPKPEEFTKKEHHRNIYVMKESTDLYVMDGILMLDKENFSSGIIIEHTWKIKDAAILKKMNVNDSLKSFTFYSSSVTAVHRYAYSITKLPTELAKLNLPIRVGNHLIEPGEYYILNEIDIAKISGTKYVPNSELGNQRKVVYGLIDVFLKK